MKYDKNYNKYIRDNLRLKQESVQFFFAWLGVKTRLIGVTEEQTKWKASMVSTGHPTKNK